MAAHAIRVLCSQGRFVELKDFAQGLKASEGLGLSVPCGV